MSRQLAILLSGVAYLALVQCTGPSAPPHSPREPDPVSVQSDATLQQTTYAIASRECRIEWVVYGTELNREVIHHYAKCSLPPAEQMPLIAKVMRRVLEDAAPGRTFRALAWGRLYPDGRPDFVLAMRLALAARRSPMWDTRRGRPKAGGINGFIRDLANEAMIYPELRAVFREAGLDIEVTSVEKVLVSPAGDLPFFDRLPGNEAKPTDKLPFDCITWFSISRPQDPT